MNFPQQPWKHDPRSDKFSHEQFFGTITPTFLPDSLNRPRTVPHDQMNTQRCTGYGNATDGEYIYAIRMSPDWAAAKVGLEQGVSVDVQGGDPNACMKSMRDYGFLPLANAPFTLQKDGIGGSGWKVWPESLNTIAGDHVIEGFVKVDTREGVDMFDAIRSALYQAYDPILKSGACVHAFSPWYDNWMSAYIPQDLGKLVGYHHYVFIDYIWENGIPYVIAQNSYGTSVGDKGFHKFPREVINRVFSSYNATLKIVKPLTTEQIRLARQETPFGKVQRAIIDLWWLITLKFNV